MERIDKPEMEMTKLQRLRRRIQHLRDQLQDVKRANELRFATEDIPDDALKPPRRRPVL